MIASVAITQAEESMVGLGPKLVAAGYEVEHIPLIEIEVDAPEPLKSEIATLDKGEYQSATVTSGYGVRYLASTGLGFDNVEFLAVGESTADKLTSAGFKVGLVAPGRNAASLAETIPPVGEHQNLLMIEGNYGNQTLHDALTAKGYEVDTVSVYQNSDLELTQVQLGDLSENDVIFLASSSAAKSLARYGTDFKVAVLSEVTGATASECGFELVELSVDLGG